MGYAAVSLAAVLWAVGGTVASALIDRGASAVELTEARAWISALGVGVMLLATRRRDRPRTGKAGVVYIVAFGLALAAANVTYYLALSRLPVAVAIVVQYTAPGLVVLWSAAVLRRRPGGRVLSALGVAFAGVVLLSEVRRAGGIDGLGLAFAVTSAFAFAAYMLTGDRVGKALGTVRGMFYAFCVASVFWGAVQAVRGEASTLTNPDFWPGILFLAVFTTIAPFMLFLWGLGRIEPARAGIVSMLEPLTAAVIAWVWLGQSLSGEQIAGAAMVVAGIAVVQSERGVKEPLTGC